MSNFSYSKLVEGLSNDDLFVRSGALFQLTESGADCQPDASHAFIDGLEKHGWQDAFVEHAYAETLPIDTEVAKRILNWLKTSPPYEPKIGEGNMSLLIMLEWLSSATAEVIKSAVGDVASLPNDESPEVEELHESIALAIDLLDHDADQCRSSLDSCRETIAKGGELETELIDIKALVKRLNDLGQIDKDLVIEWANLKADFEDEFQLSETEVKICIAFEMAKEAGIPISVDTCLDLLKHEEEWLSDSIIKTMIKMADEEMLDAMIKQYPKLSDEQKVDWLLFFEKVRFPGREEKIRDLATLEKNLSYRSHLGVLLCFYGTDPALKYARETFESLAGEIEGIDIIEVLYALKRLKGDSSDELDEWREVLDEIHSTTLKMLSGDYDMESIMDGEIDSYDPMIAPDPVIWLSMDEGERMALVRDFCEQYEGGIEGIESHAALHTVVENQLAEDPDDLPVTETLVRLMKAGVNRHEAIHALCYAMMNQIYEIQTNAKEFDLKAHTKALKELEADQWMGSAKRVEKSNYQSPSASTPKVGRNDDCPCGSGKKYKKCCIKNAN